MYVHQFAHSYTIHHYSHSLRILPATQHLLSCCVFSAILRLMPELQAELLRFTNAPLNWSPQRCAKLALHQKLEQTRPSLNTKTWCQEKTWSSSPTCLAVRLIELEEKSTAQQISAFTGNTGHIKEVLFLTERCYQNLNAGL